MAPATPKLPDIAYILNLDHLDALCRVRDNAVIYYSKFDQDDPRHAHGRRAWDMAFNRLCQLMADQFEPQSDAERDCMVALAAYEQVLEAKHGRKVKATYIRRSLLKNGVIEAISSSVLKGENTSGFNTLIVMGKSSFSFEQVVLKYPDIFEHEVVSVAQNTLKKFENTEK